MATPALSAPPAGPSAIHVATLWVFRLLTLAQATLFALQPISIGSFLDGTWTAFEMHSIVGGALLLPVTATTLVGLVLAALSRRIGLGLVCLLLPVLTVAQIAIGHTRVLAVHVPLGVLLVALALWLAIWPWRFEARPRPFEASAVGGLAPQGPGPRQ